MKLSKLMASSKACVRCAILSMKRNAVLIGRRYFSRRFLPNPMDISSAYETHMYQLYSAALKLKKGGFIDVGANIGQTLGVVLKIDPDRTYIGFEPQPYACSLIEIFIVDNGLKDKVVLPIGLSDCSGVVEFESFGRDFSTFYNTGATMVSGFYDTECAQPTKRHIVVEKGDDVLSSLDISEVSVFKIDVEGAELAVLRGSHSIIQDTRPFITFEMLPPHLRGGTLEDYKQDKLDLLTWFRKADFVVYQVSKAGHPAKIETHVDDISSETRDYIAVPSELDNEFNSLKWH